MAWRTPRELGEHYAYQLALLPDEVSRIKKLRLISAEIDDITTGNVASKKHQKELIYHAIKRSLFRRGFSLPGLVTESYDISEQVNKSYGSLEVDNCELLDLISMMRTKG